MLNVSKLYVSVASLKPRIVYDETPAATVMVLVVAVLPDAVCVAVMVVVPAATGVTTPEALIETTPAVLAWNVEPEVRF